MPPEPDEFGNIEWKLDTSIYKQRKKWADARGFHETDRSRNAAFQVRVRVSVRVRVRVRVRRTGCMVEGQ